MPDGDVCGGCGDGCANGLGDGCGDGDVGDGVCDGDDGGAAKCQLSGIFDAPAHGGLGPAELVLLRSALLHGGGVARLQGLVTPSACNELREAALRVAATQPFDGWPGVWSKRVKDPLEWGGEAAARALNEVAERVGPLLHDVLGPRAWITSAQVLVLFPVDEETLSPEAEAKLVGDSLHSDYPYGEFKEGMDGILNRASEVDDSDWQFPADFHQPRTLQFTVVLDEFTAERGATRVLPGSSSILHRREARERFFDAPPAGDRLARDAVALGGLGVRIPNPRSADDRQRFEEGCVAVEGSQGDSVVYVGHTWHTISVNRGKSPRAALLIQASPYYMAPLEAAAWMTHRAAEQHLTHRTRELLGLRGTTVEGVGGEGEGSSRVPHRCEPRPIMSCGVFALDTLLRLDRGYVSTLLVAAIGGASCVTYAVAQTRGHARTTAQLASVVMALAIGYLAGATSVVRRFDF